MKLSAVFLALPLLVLAGLAGRASDAARATPRVPPGAASLLGGFTALAVQVLWLRADKAVMDHREDDALLAFAAINELEPQLVSSGVFIADALGFDLADGHKDAAVRWSLAREGWRVLSETVKSNPDDALAHDARGQYALLRIARDPSMRSSFVRDVDAVGPLESARRDYEKALQLRPQWLEPWHGVALASLGRGREHLAAGRFDDAATCFRRAREAFQHVAEVWRQSGDSDLAPNIEIAASDVALAGELAEICGLPSAARIERYAALRRRVPGEQLPDLPKR